MIITPARLNKADEVRILAPAKSLALISDQNKFNACQTLEHEFGFSISYSRHCAEEDNFASSSIAARVYDIHQAFLDKNVKAILTVIGGYNSNQLLRYLDYNLIKDNPKIICGYSDITALTNAIYAKTSMVTFSGPHFSTFGCKKGIDYVIEYFKKCLMTEGSFMVTPSSSWSDDAWYLDQENRSFISNSGFTVINEGSTEGTIIGGNLCTLNLLHGTEFMPSLKDSIIFVEDDYLVFPEIFDRDLQSLAMQPEFEHVKGLVIGRFQEGSKMTMSTLKEICSNKKELKQLPIIANVDFGHTMPMITFPLGGKACLHAHNTNPVLLIEW